VYFQSLSHDFETSCAVSLLDRLLSDKMFDELRNKAQLGYYVACNKKDTRGVLGMEFIIQSAQFDPRYCEEKIFEFI
jgi:secreted Zn-dependent insulinase-like peptidase